LFSFPAIAAGAFVFDEIHSYDAKLFGALLRFLEAFPGAPVLIMSASIPPLRLAALHRVLGTTDADVIRGDESLERHKRYQLQPRESAEAVRPDVVAALQAGQKVLWVCNTVKSAVDTARDAVNWSVIPEEKIILFHSRFTYDHRVQRQDQVLDEFAYHHEGPQMGQRKKPRGALVIATQICEMSLDISADLLVTAECPLPSLIQRLGRLNRYASSDDAWPCLIYPFQGDPYNERPEWIQLRGDYRAGMAATRKAAKELATTPCSQQELADRLKQMDEYEEFEKYSAWLDDGWLTEPGQLRDGDSSLTVIRQEDLKEIQDKLGSRNAKPSNWTTARLVPWTIPMLMQRGFQPVDRIGGYPVAAEGTITYRRREGASWANVGE
jgi:CRISPR-associated endonuclease/helicase Cas3